MKITQEQLLTAARKARFVVEEDGLIYMPFGCDEEDPITNELGEMLEALGIEVTQ